MPLDCTQLQADYDALNQAYMDLLTGKRQVTVTYGDKTVTYAMASANQLLLARNEIGALLQTVCGVQVVGAPASRFAQPGMGDGRC